jgi:hypothetical protein
MANEKYVVASGLYIGSEIGDLKQLLHGDAEALDKIKKVALQRQKLLYGKDSR